MGVQLGFQIIKLRLLACCQVAQRIDLGALIVLKIMEPKIKGIPQAKNEGEIDNGGGYEQQGKITFYQAESTGKQQGHQKEKCTLDKAEKNNAEQLGGDPEIEDLQPDDKKPVKMRDQDAQRQRQKIQQVLLIGGGVA